MSKAATGAFRRLSLIALVAVYVLIFIGGLVRSTGSGMGCPDWPKCFGAFIPPTRVEQIPADYQQFYSDYRVRKNERFAALLTKIGMSDVATRILADPAVREEAEFNAVKTWIEYVNRLVGAVVGLILTALLVYSFRQPRWVKWWAAACWLLVVITGWFGSIVVSTNLTPWTVTIHLGLALAIVAGLSVIWSRLTFENEQQSADLPSGWYGILMLILVIQVYLGTGVRTAIDRLVSVEPDRWQWIDLAGNTFIIHRSFSWVVLAAVGFVLWRQWKTARKAFSAGLAGVVLGLLLSGIVLSYLGMPWVIQPVHLLLASMGFGVVTCLLVRSKSGKTS